ncbi:hypothetical protein [Streptomyces sp. KMM 9044]|uniref:hypothetical protein n=1 Tax=Streptomyces sp. KMM 9044 TaxID=2744474 RepID=UPI0021518B35|nr:hypothetical protein [Streptomyces sp. KMM 9044]WAX79366.1 hypothetical protein HUV60_018540 [Streptomyces sp. KMM 9044]
MTGNGNDSVMLLSPQGTPLRSITGSKIKRPMGIPSDSLGNVWVANGGAVVAPGEGTTPAMVAEAIEDLVTRHVDASVTMVRPDGTTPAKPFVNDGLFLPRGIAVDGNDTVWVANFGGHRLASLCGARHSAGPPGLHTGDPISPAGTGCTSDGLQRNTAVQIDPSGNVWLTNNWRTVPLQTNPGGHEMVVFIGLAAPVRTPLLRGPRSEAHPRVHGRRRGVGSRPARPGRGLRRRPAGPVDRARGTGAAGQPSPGAQRVRAGDWCRSWLGGSARSASTRAARSPPRTGRSWTWSIRTGSSCVSGM